jgi:hypothetical protein
MDNWIFFREVKWDEQMQQAHVDTRDFHVSVVNEPSEKTPDLTRLVKLKEQFFHSVDELKALLERYYLESGEEREGNWRFFCLEGHTNWFKYIRILKTEHGWLVCNSDFRAINKNILSTKVKRDDYH